MHISIILGNDFTYVNISLKNVTQLFQAVY